MAEAVASDTVRVLGLRGMAAGWAASRVPSPENRGAPDDATAGPDDGPCSAGCAPDLQRLLTVAEDSPELAVWRSWFTCMAPGARVPPGVLDFYRDLLGRMGCESSGFATVPVPSVGAAPDSSRRRTVTDDFGDTRLGRYLNGLAVRGAASRRICHRAAQVWEALLQVRPALPEPDAAPGEDGRLMLAFDDGDNHLEFEFLEDGHVEVFYLRRATNETWEDESGGGVRVTPKLRGLLALFCR